MTDILNLPARHIPARIAAGEITALDVTRAYLGRIVEVDGEIRAWVHLDPAKAETSARVSKPGLLHGVPIAVKDVIDTADLPTAYGSAAYPADHQPPRDAAPVALARAEGAVVLGKTVTTEFASADPGGTRHPMRATHTPGGSSSGSCAAVGSGMAPLAFGTQTSGSTIRPAAFCGIAGFKPSFGLLDRTGVKPLADSLDHLGLLARDVRDLAFLAAALRADAGWTLSDEAQPAPRLAVFRTPIWDQASAAQQAAVERAAEAAAAKGAEIVTFADPDDFLALAAAHDVVMRWEVPRALAFERLERFALLRPKTQASMVPDPAPTAAEHQAALLGAALGRIRWNMALAAAGIDAVLTPPATGEAPEGLGATGDPAFNRVWTLLYLPCVSVPAGYGPGGLPLGVQLVGAWGQDPRVLSAGAFVEDALIKA